MIMGLWLHAVKATPHAVEKEDESIPWNPATQALPPPSLHPHGYDFRRVTQAATRW
jgi:hypothetical protein